MASAGNLDYAQARLQARHGSRPRAPDWSRIEASRDLQHFLSAAMTSPLANWVRVLTPEMSPHDLERALRTEWRSYVLDVATWLPAPWQPAVIWAGKLIDLPLVARLADPAPCPGWMFADPVFGSVAPGSPAERAATLIRTDLAPLAAAVAMQSDVVHAWRAHWQRLLPAMDEDTAIHLRRLTKVIAVRVARSSGSNSAPASTFGASRQRVERIFRDSAGTPISALAHLTLAAFDLQTLRGVIAERAVFGSAQQVA